MALSTTFARRRYVMEQEAIAPGPHVIGLDVTDAPRDDIHLYRGDGCALTKCLARYPISPLGQYMEAALWPQVRRPDAHGVISHESALAIYGLSDASPATVHLTLPTGLRIRRAAPKHLVLHYADLNPSDEQRVDGVPVTTPARAIRDAHASHLGPALIRQAIVDGGRAGHLTLDEADTLERELLGTKPRSRGPASAFRTGAVWSTYFPTVVRDRPSSRATARCVRPSTSTLFGPRVRDTTFRIARPEDSPNAGVPLARARGLRHPTEPTPMCVSARP